MKKPWQERFWERVEKGEGCWLWAGSLDGKGYGQLYVNGRSALCHRPSYMMAHGVNLSRREVVRHSCDVPRCVNPDHLILGTQRENIEDMLTRRRNAVGERHPAAKLTAEKVREIRSSYVPGVNGYRRLAKHFGVDVTMIRGVVRRQTWRSVDG